MSRVTTTLLILLLLANGAASVMAASGLSEDIGVQLNPGIEQKMDTIVTDMKEGFSPNNNIVESLLLAASAFGKIFVLVAQGVFTAPTMLINLGFPEYIVVAFSAPVYLVATMELGSIVIGRRTV